MSISETLFGQPTYWTLDIVFTKDELEEKLIDLRVDKREILKIAHPMENVYTVRYI